MKQPTGYSRSGPITVAVQFEEKIFDAVWMRANVEDKSFSDTVVLLCKAGIVCLDESDAMEPKS